MNHARATDAQLVAAFQDGDTTAFDEIHARYEQDVAKVCWANTKDAEHARDAQQETFLTVLRLLPTFDGGELLGHYIRKTARLTAQDRRGTRRRTREVPSEMERHGGACSDEENALNAALVDSLLGTLTDRERHVLAGRHLFGFSRAELAEQLGTTPGYVGIMLHRAVTSLRDASTAARALVLVPLLAMRDLLRRAAGRDVAAGYTMQTAVTVAVLGLATVAPQGSAGTLGTADAEIRALAPAIAELEPIHMSATSPPSSDAALAGTSPTATSPGADRSNLHRDAAPSTDLPDVLVPGTDVGFKDEFVEDPAYSYRVAGGGVEVLQVDVDDEPEQDPLHEGTCDQVGQGALVTCSRSHP